MVSIGLCMIVKNEESVLGRCLKSVAGLTEEIIVVDTGSTDATRAVALSHGATVYDFVWIDDFAAARNYSFSLAKSDYCLWLDADDVLTAEDAEKFRRLKAELDGTAAVVMLPYHTGFDEKGHLIFSYFRERLIKNHGEMHWVGPVHEVVPPVGQVLYGECAITHQKTGPGDPDRNLRIFEAQLQKGLPLDARQRFYYGRELYYHKKYGRALAVLEEFLADQSGWVENKIDACRHCAYCLYQLEREEDSLCALLKTLAYDLPRAETCCELGKHFFDRERWQQAAFWYTLALDCQRDDARGGFVVPECYDYVPHIQLCVCYSCLGDETRAEACNEQAASYRPDSPAVAQNRRYFATVKGNKTPKS